MKKDNNQNNGGQNMTNTNELEFEADLGIWECFGGKDVMKARQAQVLKEIGDEW